MTTALELLLAEVKRATKCEAIEGEVLPLPPSSFPDTSALLVNCYFRPETLNLNAPELLIFCRECANQSLRTIGSFVRGHEMAFDTIGVSVFHNSGVMSSIRVYWANSRKDLLSKPSGRITFEGTHLGELGCLLSTGP